MSELYEIRPLEWEGDIEYVQSAKSICFMAIYVHRTVATNRWHWTVDNHREDCDSLDAGKLAAEAYYRERLLTALKPVEDKT